MTTSKRIAVKVGEYTNNAGEKKGRWKTLGELITKDDGGMFIKLDATILNAACFALMNRERNDQIIASLFSDDNQRAPAAAPSAASGINDMTDDIPF